MTVKRAVGNEAGFNGRASLLRKERKTSGSSTRETNKAEKRQRIKLAARALFSRYGYDETTLRQIAVRAGVALGTLSLYAKDKRDLILLMFNDDIAEMIERGRASVTEDAGFLDNLIAYFRVFYMEFASDIKVSRAFLQLNFFSDGMHTAELARNRDRMLAVIREIVELAKSQRRLKPEESSDSIAHSIFFVYVGAVRWWIAEDKPDFREGLTQLRSLLRLQADGYKAAAGVAPLCQASR